MPLAEAQAAATNSVCRKRHAGLNCYGYYLVCYAGSIAKQQQCRGK